MRYQTFDNILWMSGNDFQSWRIRTNTTRAAIALALGIKQQDKAVISTPSNLIMK